MVKSLDYSIVKRFQRCFMLVVAFPELFLELGEISLLLWTSCNNTWEYFIIGQHKVTCNEFRIRQDIL